MSVLGLRGKGCQWCVMQQLVLGRCGCCRQWSRNLGSDTQGGAGRDRPSSDEQDRPHTDWAAVNARCVARRVWEQVVSRTDTT
jgi:hypothetical protein